MRSSDARVRQPSLMTAKTPPQSLFLSRYRRRALKTRKMDPMRRQAPPTVPTTMVSLHRSVATVRPQSRLKADRMRKILNL